MDSGPCQELLVAFHRLFCSLGHVREVLLHQAAVLAVRSQVESVLLVALISIPAELRLAALAGSVCPLELCALIMIAPCLIVTLQKMIMMQCSASSMWCYFQSSSQGLS